MQSMLSRKVCFSGERLLRSFLRWYIFLFDNGFTLGLFTSASVALFCHEILILVLHRPLSFWGLFFAWPFLFVFDLITIILLYHGLTSTTPARRLTAGIVAILIISLSAIFASLYFEANAELNWTRSAVV
jgi:uncharacterized membrane protein